MTSSANSEARPIVGDSEDIVHMDRSSEWNELKYLDQNRTAIIMAEIEKTDEEWRKQLTPEQYAVTRRKGTEPAFTGQYYDHHEEGVYRCVCCGNPLFDPETKFESGTGWPSFYQPVAPDKRRDRDRRQLRDAPRRGALCASATPTWATSSTTAPSRPASATA